MAKSETIYILVKLKYRPPVVVRGNQLGNGGVAVKILIQHVGIELPRALMILIGLQKCYLFTDSWTVFAYFCLAFRPVVIILILLASMAVIS